MRDVRVRCLQLRAVFYASRGAFGAVCSHCVLHPVTHHISRPSLRAHALSSMHPLACDLAHWQVGVAGVENVNLSKLVAGHQDYLTAMGDILEVLNLHC